MENIQELARSFLILPLTPSCVSYIEQFINVIVIEIDKRVKGVLDGKINVNSVMTSLRLLFRDELLLHLLNSGHTYLSNNISSILVFSKDGYSNSCCKYISGVLEYICSDILQIAEVEAHSQEKKEITEYNLVKGLQDDIEWKYVINKLKICFLIPFVHPQNYNYKKNSILDIQTKHKLIIPHHPFMSIVKEILNTENEESKISKRAVVLIQHYIEVELIDYLLGIRKQHLTSKITSKHLCD